MDAETTPAKYVWLVLEWDCNGYGMQEFDTKKQVKKYLKNQTKQPGFDEEACLILKVRESFNPADLIGVRDAKQ